MHQTITAFIVFCLASSSIYFVNDLSDIAKDRLHPFKKNRPIASGKVSTRLALLVAVGLFLLTLLFSLQLSVPFTLIVLLFYGLHLLYSFYLKNLMLIDILAIAGGFILRVLAGEVVTGFHINVWLFLTVISASLFLAIGKRRSELTLMSGWEDGVPAKTRATLSHYSEKMLDVYLSMFATSAWITYAFYTFLAPPPVLRRSIGNILEINNLSLVQDRKWLTLTIPFVIYGVMRYLQLIYEKNEGESPEKVLLSDWPILVTVGTTAIALFGIIYILGR